MRLTRVEPRALYVRAQRRATWLFALLSVTVMSGVLTLVYPSDLSMVVFVVAVGLICLLIGSRAWLRDYASITIDRDRGEMLCTRMNYFGILGKTEMIPTSRVRAVQLRTDSEYFRDSGGFKYTVLSMALYPAMLPGGARANVVQMITARYKRWNQNSIPLVPEATEIAQFLGVPLEYRGEFRNDAPIDYANYTGGPLRRRRGSSAPHAPTM